MYIIFQSLAEMFWPLSSVVVSCCMLQICLRMRESINVYFLVCIQNPTAIRCTKYPEHWQIHPFTDFQCCWRDGQVHYFVYATQLDMFNVFKLDTVRKLGWNEKEVFWAHAQRPISDSRLTFLFHSNTIHIMPHICFSGIFIV